MTLAAGQRDCPAFLPEWGMPRADLLAASDAATEVAPYRQVISMPKKCTNTSRFGLFFGLVCGLRI